VFFFFWVFFFLCVFVIHVSFCGLCHVRLCVYVCACYANRF